MKLCFFTCITFSFFLSGLISCKPTLQLETIPAFTSETTVNCIIEIPAGTNKKIEFNKTTKRFKIDKINGVERIKNYLPYPANYGFIPATFSDKAKGGDGDPIDILLLCESIPTGSVIEAYPIAMLRVLDDGEMDDKIICIPKDPELQVIQAEDITEFQEKYPKALEIIELWFQYNDTTEPIVLNGWVNKKETIAEIKRVSTWYQETNFPE